MNSGHFYTPFCVTAVFMLGTVIGMASNEIHTFHKFMVVILATTAFHFAHTYSKKQK